MKTKKEIEEYKESIEIEILVVKNFLLLNKGNYYTVREISIMTGMSYPRIGMALSRYSAMPNMHGIKKEFINEYSKTVLYFGWE